MICHEIDYVEPIIAADSLRCRPGFAFLDSSSYSNGMGRYSFIGTDPFGIFVIDQVGAIWNGDRIAGDPLRAFRALLTRYSIEDICVESPLRAGCIGHVTYDFGRRLERLDTPVPTLPAVSDMRFGFYDVIHAFDQLNRRAWIFSSGLPETEAVARGVLGQQRLDAALKHLSHAAQPPSSALPVTDWRSNFTRDSFCAAVERVRDYILDGDIYQANIAQRFEAILPDGYDPWTFYRRLRTINPAPFSAYLSDGETVFASSSPERFLSLRDGVVEARPIKGTTGRASDPAEDQALAAELKLSEKDRAENTMIVDLLRNDLSRICVPGSIEVPVLCGLETYASVHHLTSVVHGRICPGLGAIDLIESCFPGGSITGAPKLRAMNIITELERTARGIYCGSIGYIGFDGAMDLNIAIRTATLGSGRATFQAGGGITLLSEGASEYAETQIKAQRLFDAFSGDCSNGASPGCF